MPNRPHRSHTATALACALVLGGCADGERPPPAPTKTATSENGVRFRFIGNRLTVTVPPDASPTARSFLRARAVDFFCGKRGQLAPYAPVPNARVRFPQGRREVTVALRGTDDRFFAEAAFCGMEHPRGEVFGYFIPIEEILGVDGVNPPEN